MVVFFVDGIVFSVTLILKGVHQKPDCFHGFFSMIKEKICTQILYKMAYYFLLAILCFVPSTTTNLITATDSERPAPIR